jgi:hypothetical protein
MTATTIIAPVRVKLNIGRTVSRTAGLFWRLSPILLVVGAATVGVTSAFFEVLRSTGAVASPGDDVLASMKGAPGENVIVGLAGLVLTGAAIFAALGHMSDRSVDVGAAFGAGGRYFGRLFGIGFLSNLGIILGLILLVVPGLILWARWSAAGPAGIGEKRPVGDAMKRSAQLTEGTRFNIIVVGLIGLLAAAGGMLVIMFLTGFIDGMLQDRDAVTNFIGLPLVTVLFVALSAVGRTVIYDELVRAREGGRSDDLSEVFA